jgi:hypothetical protein
LILFSFRRTQALKYLVLPSCILYTPAASENPLQRSISSFDESLTCSLVHIPVLYFINVLMLMLPLVLRLRLGSGSFSNVSVSTSRSARSTPNQEIAAATTLRNRLSSLW